jgi:ribosome maturation factor RimP
VAGEEDVVNGSSRRAEPHSERLTVLLEPVVTEAGLELESIRVSRAGNRRVLRVVVDGEHGVNMDDIARVSRAVAAEIDDRDAMGAAAYTLEVSSPGVDRPLTEPRHWRRAAGRLVHVSVKDLASLTAKATSAPKHSDPGGKGNKAAEGKAAEGKATGANTIEGRVVTAGPDSVTLEIDGERRELDYVDLGPGQIQVEFGGSYGDLGGPANGSEDLDEDLAGGEPDGH